MRQANSECVKLENILSGTLPKYNYVRWIYRSRGRICPDAFGCYNKILSFAAAIKLKPGQTCGLMVADRLLIWSLWASKINAARGTLENILHAALLRIHCQEPNLWRISSIYFAAFSRYERMILFTCRKYHKFNLYICFVINNFHGDS